MKKVFKYTLITSMSLLSLVTLASCGKINFSDWARPTNGSSPTPSTSYDPYNEPTKEPVTTVTTTTVIQSGFEYSKKSDGTYEIKNCIYLIRK